jgi:hypothetical protein
MFFLKISCLGSAMGVFKCARSCPKKIHRGSAD